MMMGDDLERLSLRGPAAIEQQLLEKRASYRQALVTATKAAERNQLKKMIAVMNAGRSSSPTGHRGLSWLTVQPVRDLLDGL
jgi:hypothetical protein